MTKELDGGMLCSEESSKKYEDVNLFRNTVNDVRNLSTCPGKQLTTLSEKEQKTVNQNQ